MHNPPHPGEFISAVYLEPNGPSGRELATKLGVAASTLTKCLGRSPESRLALQYSHTRRLHLRK